MSDLFVGGLVFLIPFVIIAVFVFAIVAVVTARRDPDPAGHRPYAVYLSLALFLSVFTVLFAGTAAVSSLIRIPLDDYGAGFTQLGGQVTTGPVGQVSGAIASQLDDQHLAGVVAAGLVLFAAVLVMWFHVKRLRELVQEPGFSESAGRRTYQVYLHAVSFVAIAILLFGGAAALYGLFRAIAPDTTGPFTGTSFERGQGIAQATSAAFLALGAWAIFLYHWHRTTTLRGLSPHPVEDRGPRHAAPTAKPPQPAPKPPEPAPKPAQPTPVPVEQPKPAEPSKPAEPAPPSPQPKSSEPPSDEAPPPAMPPL